MMIKAIVFDIGDVVLKEYPGECRRVLADTFGFDAGDFKVFAKEKLKKSYSGELSAVGFFSGLKEHLGIEASVEDLVEKWKSVRLERAHFNDEVVSMIKNLRGNYLIVSLANSTILNDVVRKKLEVYDLFELNVVSFEVGTLKPDRKIYEVLLKRLGEKDISVDEVVFIDDKTKNLDPAAELGMKTVLFEGAESLKKKLLEIGVEF